MVDSSCLAYAEADGACTSCYPGYTVSGRTCILSNTTATNDPFCKTYSTTDVCAECSSRYFINGFGKCQEVSTFCKTYNQNTGSCLSCYSGFALEGTTCLETTSAVTDQYCKTWQGSVCLECSFGAFFLSSGVCAVANPLCKTFSQSNGQCLSCYNSFELSGGDCVKSVSSLSDPNCAEFYQ